MTTNVSPNYFHCLLKLQEKNHKVYSWADIGNSLGISRQAALNLFMHKPSENGFVKYSTIAGLLNFFASEGMPVTIADLFVVTPEPASAKALASFDNVTESEPPR